MNIFSEKRVVLTLDAGGTNFVFGAILAGKELIEPITMPAYAVDLEKCLNSIIDGFNKVKRLITQSPSAISFAFPGPADYKSGIIGDLVNLPAFRGGIPLAEMLKQQFQIPVFIQNDGDLFAYGEAIGGILPEINLKMEQLGIQKRYKNLVGLTLGTGFGAGIVQNQQLFAGDNSIPAEVWNISNSISPDQNAEEGISTRAIIKTYSDISGHSKNNFMPADIYQIATGEKDGNVEAAKESFHKFGIHLGDTIANLIMLLDSIVVIGGGITGAANLYMPAAMSILKGSFVNNQSRVYHEVFYLDQERDCDEFYLPTERKVKVPFSSAEVIYDPVPKVGVVTSKLGASKAISLGAYAYAIDQLNKTN